MKRHLRALAACAAIGLGLTACGGSDSSSDPTEGASAAGETRTVESPFTDEQVEIPVEPQRVVALWRTGSILADLDAPVVAGLDGEFLETELGPEVFEKYSSIESVGTFEGVDLDALAAAEPDLIVGMDNGGLEVDYDAVKEIAPTVILDIAEPTDVWANYPTIADLVGQSTDYEEKQAALDADLAAIKEEYGDELADLQTSIISTYEGTVTVYTSKSLVYDRLVAAGFGYNSAYTDNPERYVVEISTENLPDFEDQDVIFYQTDLDGTVPAETQQLIDSDSYKALSAVKAGHSYPMSSGTIYTFAGAQAEVENLREAAEALAQ